ncbi:alcohol dehydrogenase catalytic domain-containing protein [Aneurinibacillus sp. Ricciae_BoGa-3]|uniref:zinc-dependent alcohol dehydrogenase n=1 Tax=Aneurinibacillus sp. Ricciae_BoGa-3 TaxID=3022697 RepID=UPI00234252B7|nr:alcohol dehydrogenase catalytic domain-containing protein [Aneurinibacillus sp. Ricciae_BoGa-3]WCK53222.1 alcohol dehydrogenase catalytic domain-containing protein [Aneurinibacillus sp. Ricciae_BoGa-3]
MTEMRAGLYLGERTVAADKVAKPVAGEGEALIRIAYAGICGTDMMIYFGKHPRARAPLAMGHEFSGVIEEIRGASSFAPGDRVVIEPTLSCGECEACAAGQFHVCKTLRLIGIDQSGGFAEYAAVPLHRLHRIPDKLSDIHAAVTEPVAVAVHTVRRSNLKLGDNVVILGAGPIGLLTALVARQGGAHQIIISDISPYRLEKAKQLGFTVLDAKHASVTDEVASLTGGVGADIVFEVAGNQITAKQMIETVKIQGQIVVVSVFKQAPTIDLAAMHFREISLTTTRCYSNDDFKKAIVLMRDGTIDVSPIISHLLPLEQIHEGFHLMEDSNASLKVLFQL